MIKKLTFKLRLKASIILLIILMTSIFINISTNFFNETSNSEKISDDGDDITDFNPTEPTGELKSSALGDDTWWDKSFRYRRLINITNLYDVSFTDFGVNVNFNYVQLGDRIQGDLDDIRIVENGELRDFYVVKDYPSDNCATIWFDTNISQSTSEVDTYMYYGNPDAVNNESSSEFDSFGWIKNGDFEFDTSTDTKYIPYGWNFTDDPIDTMQGVDVSNGINDEPFNNTEIANSYENFVFGLTSDTDGYHGIGQGSYAYKWGNPANALPSVQSFEYVGTLYTYPFTVPIVDSGAGNISITLWRNPHTYIFDKRNQDIDYDGYYIRLCNGSAAKYTYEVDNHEEIGHGGNNYIEAYGGNARFAARWREEWQLREHYDGDVKDTVLGELTGYVTFDLTPYMGQDIFLEYGSWGREDGDLGTTQERRGAFFQIDDLRFNYTLTASMDEIQHVDSDVTIVAVDVDGRIVPNAEIFIVNNSAEDPADFIVNSSIASDGTITFYNVPRGRYNITVNYTLGNDVVEVFNSSKSGIGPYYFNGINYTVQIQLDLWTIDFEIVDWDGIPLKYGYIEVNESDGGNLLATLPLDSNGKATFRWENTSMYYYKVYYKNDDYYGDFSPIALNESYIYRTSYDKNNEKYQNHTLYVNETHIGSYSISERIYTNGSRTILGNKKINKININLTDMDNYLTDISVYYIDKDNSTDGNLIYYEEYPSPPDDIKNDFIQLDISLIENDNLKNDNYEAYGLLILVNGYNSTVSNGIIKVDLIETCNIYNKSALARINIKTIFYNEISEEIDELSALVKVVDNATGRSLVNLTSAGDAIAPLEDGYAYGQINEVPFWYLIGQVYNFTIEVGNESSTGTPPGIQFNISISGPGPSQWIPGSGEMIGEYNYTLYGNSSITFFIIPIMDMNFTDFESLFNSSYGETEAFWGEYLDYWVHFLFTDDGWDTWDIVEKPPAIVYLNIKVPATGEVLITSELYYDGSGNFTINFNSSILSAGNDFEYYTFEITGYHPTYDNPIPVTFLVKLKAIPTSIASYNYDSRLLLTSNLYAQNYAELVNITITYNISETGKPLDGATVAYTWDFGSGTLEPDQVWTDFYTMTLNTSDALSTGIKIITITASFENYSSAPITIYLNVLKRATTLNGQTGLVYNNPKIWVQDAHYYNFTYSDSKTTLIIGDLQIAVYSWQLLDSSGNPIIGKSGSGTLSQNADKIYTLDFNTGIKPLGYYQLYITLGKENYEERFALINLEIRLREFDADLDATDLEDDKVSIVKGNNIEFEIELFDETRGNIPLTGAKVVLEIGDEEYEFDEDDPGIYTYTFSTEEIDAFFTSQTLTGEIIIKKVNFTSEEIDITIVVEMEEIFDGMPTFYLILLVAIIGGIIGSLVSYRVIQQARIPGFVKKIRKVKNTIKAKKPITESYSIPTMEQMILKQFGTDWKAIGFSLEDNLGIKDLKSKSSTEENKITKVRGENN